MTVKEFYERAKREGKEDYEMLVQYRDDGGFYFGKEVVSEISEEHNSGAYNEDYQFVEFSNAFVL